MKAMGDELIDELANIIYREDFISNASEYLETRQLNQDHFRFPWALSNGNRRIFKYLEDQGLAKSFLFETSLFIPIVSVSNPNKLEGFDIRYLGNSDIRTRYMKLQREPNSFLLYNIGDLVEHPERPTVITEGAIDCETLRSLELEINVISPLRNRHGIPFCTFLSAISDNIYLAYDQDSAGKKSKDKILSTFDVSPEIRKTIKPLAYMGKDLNDSLIQFGKAQLKKKVMEQIDFNQHTRVKDLATTVRNLKI